MCNLPSTRFIEQFTVTSDLPSTARFVVVNPEADPQTDCKVAQSRYVTNSAYNAWLKFQSGCKAYMISNGTQREIDYRLLMLLGSREARALAPKIMQWQKQSA